MANQQASKQENQREYKPVDSKKLLHNFKYLTDLGWGAKPTVRFPVIPLPSAGDVPTRSPEKSPSGSPEKENEKDLPWNLRKRKPWSKHYENPSPRNGKVMKLDSKEDLERKKKIKNPLSIGLSAKEMEADILLMFGKKPARKPNKRPKQIQNKVDEIVPGMWLSQTKITPDLYKVEEEKQ